MSKHEREFTPARPLTKREAALLADEVLARAGAALRLAAPRKTVSQPRARTVPMPWLRSPWLEGAVMSAAVLVAVAGCLLHPPG